MDITIPLGAALIAFPVSIAAFSFVFTAARFAADEEAKDVKVKLVFFSSVSATIGTFLVLL